MKTILCLSLGLLTTVSVLAQRYVIDNQQSKLNWTGHAEIGSYSPTGTIQLRQGSIELRNGQINRGRVDIDMQTIQHENGQMQAHLRGEDFFDAAKFPTATLIVQSVSGGRASGQLTLKGVTQPVSFPVVLSCTPDELRIKGQVTIDRTAFGINYNSSNFFTSLGDRAIRNTFEVTFEVVARRSTVVIK